MSSAPSQSSDIRHQSPSSRTQSYKPGSSSSSTSPSRARDPSSREVHSIPVIRDTVTFDTRQAMSAKEIEKKMIDEVKRKEREWQRCVETMREEFLNLHPCEPSASFMAQDDVTCQKNINITNAAGTKHAIDAKDGSIPEDPHVAKRRGSTEVLDTKKMKTLVVDYPRVSSDQCLSRGVDSSCLAGDVDDVEAKLKTSVPVAGSASANGYNDSDTNRRFQLRFNVSGFDLDSIRVITDGVRIIVQATKKEKLDGEAGVDKLLADGDGRRCNPDRQQYYRKIQKPKEVDDTKLLAFLSSDAILVVEAPLPPKVPRGDSSEGKRKKEKAAGAAGRMSHSASRESRESRDSNVSRASSHDSARKSPASNSSPAETPGVASKEKIGVPIFRDENGTRKMHLAVELGAIFDAADITVQVIKEDKIQIRAKHRVKTTEVLFKSKFNKEYELGEKIETYSLKGGLTSDGKLIVNAYAKGHGEMEEDEEIPLPPPSKSATVDVIQP